MRLMCLVAACAMTLAIALVGAAGAGAEIREFSTGLTVGAEPNGIALGSDGAMWFTEYGTSTIGRIAPDGSVGEYPPSATKQLQASADVSAIVAGPDGNIWFSEYGTGMVGDLSPTTGKLLGEYPVGPATSDPEGITVGHDGNLWVALRGDRALARIVPSSVVPGTADGITVFPLSSSDTDYQPVDLVTGPDGRLWVSDNLGGVWRVDPSNPQPSSNQFFVISGNSPQPGGITSANGMLWVVLFGGSQVAQINPATVTSPIAPSVSLAAGTKPLWIASAADGNLWITVPSSDELLRLSPTSHAVTPFGAAAAITGDPNTDATDRSGNLWFTEFHADKIGEAVFALVNTVAPQLGGDAAPSGTLTCSSGQWSPAADAFAYQWLRDGVAVAGATASSYKLPSDATGHAFACEVTATQTAYMISGSATSAPVTATGAGTTPTGPSPKPGPPATLRNVTAPTITGPLKENGTLTCQPGTWSVPGAKFAYQWSWDGDATLTSGIPTRFKGKVLGASPSALRKLRNSALGSLHLVTFAQTQRLTVPELSAPTIFRCTVIATVPNQLPVAANSRNVTINPGPPALARNIQTLRFTPPHINPKVGVSGQNICQPGRWTGDPKFSYTWYRVTADRRLVSRRRYTPVGNGQAYTLAPADEARHLECWVTGRNRYGSDTERSNQYQVPLGAPHLLSQVDVRAATSAPIGITTFGGSGFGAVTAEQVELTCLPGNWNRSDLSFSYQWNTDGEDHPETGSVLNFDMRPGRMQYDTIVTCTVTAKTSHGVTSVATSEQLFVDSGCIEDYTLNGTQSQMGFPPFTYSNYPTYVLLNATSLPEEIFEGPGGRAVTGLFGFRAFDIDIQPGQSPHRAATFGPNCGNYQSFLRNMGFDVKQDGGGQDDWVNS